MALQIKTADVDLQQKFMRGGIKTVAGKNRVIPIADKILPFIAEFYDTKKISCDRKLQVNKLLKFQAKILGKKRNFKRIVDKAFTARRQIHMCDLDG